MSILILLAHCLLPGTTHPLRCYKAIWFGTEQASCYTVTPFLFCLPRSHFLFSSFSAHSLSVAQSGPPEKQLLNQQRGRPNSCSRSPPGLNRPHMKVGKSSSGVCQAIICPCSPPVPCHGDTPCLLKSDTHTFTYLLQRCWGADVFTLFKADWPWWLYIVFDMLDTAP